MAPREYAALIIPFKGPAGLWKSWIVSEQVIFEVSSTHKLAMDRSAERH